MTIMNRMESLAARATMAGEDVRCFLEKDHDGAKELVEKIVAANQGGRRLTLLIQLKTALTAHSRAEESTVYEPMLTAKSPDSRDLANEGYVEHAMVDRLLADLANGEPSSSRWVATAKVLKELLEHHIASEQTDTFAELGVHFDADQLRAMGVAFLRAKAAILESKSVPHRIRRGPHRAATRTGARAPVRKAAPAAAQPQMERATKKSPHVRQRG